MSVPYIGEIRLFGFGRAPVDWLSCDGRTVPIQQFAALYSLIGTIYGGDGIQTFGLPDLRGRVPIGLGLGPTLSNRVIGEKAGTETVLLADGQIPAHSHALTATTNAANTATPGPSAELAKASIGSLYAPPANVTSYELMARVSIKNTGGNLPHPNLMPTLVCNYCIATAGIYPTPP